jgi:hypothetical protein
VLKNDHDILQYQLTQLEPQRFELNLVAVDEPAFQRVLGRALPELERLLGPGALVEANYRTEFGRNSGGKFRAVASLCKQPKLD